MILRDIAPHPSLNGFVQCYRIVHFDFGGVPQPVRKAYSPRPEVCLHFFLRQRELVQLANKPAKDFGFPVVLAGQQTAVINRYLAGKEFVTFNIIFQPTAMFRLTGISASELTDQYLNAEDLFSTDINLILEQLQIATGYSEMISIANRFVSSLVEKGKKNDHVLDNITSLMLKAGEKISVDWLARESCLSPKQFKRKFYERTGVNPKTYQRIIRFNRAYNLRNAYPERDWLRIAIECDYFDYQHLVRDYKEFTKTSPNEFHFIESNSPERTLGLTGEIYKSRAELYKCTA